MRLTRRGLLTASAVSGLLVGCGAEEAPPDATATDSATDTPPPATRRIRYGEEHSSQFADLRLPAAAPAATVVLLHGGYWRPDFGLDLMDPLAERFTALGFATWNVEYRRTDAGGGVPQTLADVAAAVDRLAGPGLPTGLARQVVVVGHSAGGHLAAWAASRTDATPGGLPSFPLRGAISLAGVLDLTRAAGTPGSSDPVTDFVGGTPEEVPDSYALADPTRLVPAACPVWVLHAEDDTTVPAEQSESYVAAARAAGGDVERIVVPGGHLEIIDPRAAAFSTLEKLVRRIPAQRP